MPLAATLEKIAPLSDECKTALRAVTHLKSYLQGRTLVAPGQINDKLLHRKRIGTNF